MTGVRYADRPAAGRALVPLLAAYAGRADAIVLALPRGGVPVAAEVAAALHLPLDVLVVRKLGVPGHRELAMGAIASGGRTVLNESLVREMAVAPDAVAAVVEQERRELQRREQAYRAGRPALDVTGRIVVLVDDGLATGASMRVAIAALTEGRPARIVVAVPTAPASTRDALAALVDEVACPSTPSPFVAVGAAYEDFRQTSDDEVRDLLRAARHAPPAT